ncbi:hypothetical protein [Halosegnis marinus]|uniref:DUF2795 domain-containing protein n=1 Tax=Halosegnis marinus TaxID=3034023 RepID=A0ABD5ZQX8_9EURY|nr:hypothetical protein [Halosegnis sp. DT85]
MTERKLTDLPDLLATLDYPVPRADAAAAFDGVTLLLADGEVGLDDAVRACPSERFADAGELESELYGSLPTEAVGEPGQSEGDA